MVWRETRPRGLGPEAWGRRDRGRDVHRGSQWLRGPRRGGLGAWGLGGVGQGHISRAVKATVSSLDVSSKPPENFTKLGWVAM